MKIDELYLIFEQHLYDLDVESQSQVDFISKVVDQYINNLKNFGYVSIQHEIDLRDEIEEEVTLMLRKKIYGHFNLDQYRSSLRFKTGTS